ncbi:hypothetical protein C8Q77DRAFT_1057716 [Trametes polyzona]|nr:hypothetical protein C8Q77DRAFT_1057716 [Trametes polyzona]
MTVSRTDAPALKRSSSFQENRTSGSWKRDLNNFSHLRGPNPTLDERSNVDRNPLGHIRSTGPDTADPDSLVEDTSDPTTPTDERAITPTKGGRGTQADNTRSGDQE